jgi:hypothetical protein
MDSRRDVGRYQGGSDPQPFLIERFTQAFRLYLDTSEGGSRCPEESDFEAMYAVLGDYAAQDAIRAENPDAKHCEILTFSPGFCKSCPKNPHLQEGPALDPREMPAWHGDIETVAHLLMLADAGVTITLDTLQYRTALLIQAAKTELNRRQSRKQPSTRKERDKQRDLMERTKTTKYLN